MIASAKPQACPSVRPGGNSKSLSSTLSSLFSVTECCCSAFYVHGPAELALLMVAGTLQRV